MNVFDVIVNFTSQPAVDQTLATCAYIHKLDPQWPSVTLRDPPWPSVTLRDPPWPSVALSDPSCLPASDPSLCMTALSQPAGMQLQQVLETMESPQGLSGKHFHRAVLSVPGVPDVNPEKASDLHKGKSDNPKERPQDIFLHTTTKDFSLVFRLYQVAFCNSTWRQSIHCTRKTLKQIPPVAPSSSHEENILGISSWYKYS